jgi:hypothetical protein
LTFSDKGLKPAPRCCTFISDDDMLQAVVQSFTQQPQKFGIC